METTEHLMNAHQIALQMNRTRRAIVINLEGLGIEPKLKAGRALYYDPIDAIPKLKAKMRRENWNKKEAQPA